MAIKVRLEQPLHSCEEVIELWLLGRRIIYFTLFVVIRQRQISRTGEGG